MRTKEQIKEYNRLYHLKHKDELNKKHYQRNLDNPTYTKEYYLKNKDKILSKSREYHRNNPEKSRARAYKAKYNITIEDYNILFDKQKGNCAVCNEQFIGHADVDHNHTTGKVRGLLCHNCNISLGHYEKNKDLFEVYLNDYN